MSGPLMGVVPSAKKNMNKGGLKWAFDMPSASQTSEYIYISEFTVECLINQIVLFNIPYFKQCQSFNNCGSPKRLGLIL